MPSGRLERMSNMSTLNIIIFGILATIVVLGVTVASILIWDNK